jgi:hypothetical protein
MFSILKPDPTNEHKNSLSVTYPRVVNIIYGNYPYPEVLNYFMIETRRNIDPKMENYTNVKGGMTDWCHFVEDEKFTNFMVHIINKYQTTHEHIFKHFFERQNISNAWGNEIKKGDSLDYHTHSCVHGILYLTEGCDLILPELNIRITPQPGDYYILPAEIIHGFEKSTDEENRYSLIFNIESKNNFDYVKRVKQKK